MPTPRRPNRRIRVAVSDPPAHLDGHHCRRCDTVSDVLSPTQLCVDCTAAVRAEHPSGARVRERIGDEQVGVSPLI